MSKEKKEYPMVTCKLCGKEDKACYGGGVGDAMVANSLCFNCEFWRERVEQKDLPHCLVVGGGHYQIGDESGDSRWRGFGGAEWHIRYKDGRPDVVSTNLWFQGIIPAHYRSQLPDTAEFIKEHKPAC